MTLLRQLLHRVGQVAVLALSTAVLATIVLQWTGTITVIVPSGNSMEPGIAAGDLVVLRAKDYYQVGDVVAYQSDDLGTVLHRIIDARRAAGGDSFLLQGDNNDFVDAERPDESAVRGEMVFHIPNGARGLGLLPLFIVLAAMAWWWTTSDGSPRGRTAGSTGFDDGVDLRRAIGTSAALVFGGIAVLSVFTSPTEPVERTLLHSSNIDLNWLADVDVSPVYPDGRLRTGDPAFLNSVDELRVQARAVFDDQIEGLSGDLQLLAVASDPSGWSRELPLTPRRTIDNSFRSLEGQLALNDLWTDLREVAALTSYDPGRYDLTLHVRGTLNGVVGGNDINHAIDHEIDFFLDGVVLRPKPDQNAELSIGGLVTVEDAREGRIGPEPLALPVAWVRLLAPFGLAICLVLTWWKRPDLTSAEIVSRRFGNHVLDVQEQALPIEGPIVNLEKFDDMLRLAQIEGAPILHLADGVHHEWATSAFGVWYRYLLPITLATNAAAEPHDEAEPDAIDVQ